MTTTIGALRPDMTNSRPTIWPSSGSHQSAFGYALVSPRPSEANALSMQRPGLVPNQRSQVPAPVLSPLRPLRRRQFPAMPQVRQHHLQPGRTTLFLPRAVRRRRQQWLRPEGFRVPQVGRRTFHPLARLRRFCSTARPAAPILSMTARRSATATPSSPISSASIVSPWMAH
jgi:hypothetical protein